MKRLFPISVILVQFVVNQSLAQGFVQSPYQDFALSAPLVADFNGDQKLDVLGIQFGAEKVVLQLNSGATPIAFSNQDLGLSLSPAGQPVAADFDGDQDMDVVVSESGSFNLTVLRNDGTGHFSTATSGVTGATNLVAGDFDHDQDMDIVGYNYNSGAVYYFKNNGNLSFTSSTLLASDPNLDYIASGDLDNDGDPDIVLGFSTFSGKQIVVYQSNGDNTFTEKPVAADQFSSLSGLTLTDIDKDGKRDIIACRNSNTEVFLNKGNFTFERKFLFSGSGFIRSVVAGDFNTDGKTDLMVGFNSSGISWYKQSATAPLTFESLTVGGVSPAYYLVTGDFDNDNDADVVASNGEFWWYENQNQQEHTTGLFSLEAGSVRVFPNPFHDYFQLQGIENGRVEVKILDVNGRAVYTSSNPSAQIRPQLLTPGIYFLLVRDLENSITGKGVIIKE